MNKINIGWLSRRLSTLIAVATLILCLIAAFTGILLAFYYQPTAGGAFTSLRWIVTEVDSGWLIQRLHDLAGNGAIALGLLQIVVMFISRCFTPGWYTAWVSGILLTLTAMGLSWTAMILSWDQIGYWRFNLELSTLQAIPWIGPTLRQILTGGGAINTITVEHLYTLHSYVLSGVAIALALVHLGGLLFQERTSLPDELAQGTTTDSTSTT